MTVNVGVAEVSRKAVGSLLATSCTLVAVTLSACMGVKDTRPNILLIVADDLGYTDLGVYGGEIHTPNIDALATEGLLFTHFHTGPACEVTRSMLLSGNNHYVAGMRGEGAHLSARVAPLPRVLRDAGYRTYMTGKWHLGESPARSPTAAGFDHYFVLVQGAGNHFNSKNFRTRELRYLLDGVDVDYPDGEYSTEVYTDRLIEFIDAERAEARPFFAFAAYTSPHWPLQVPEEYRNLYAGRYNEGYDALRLSRLESAIRAGVVPPTASLPERDPAVRPWSDLGENEGRTQAREMELYAAMVENLDHHVGRLVSYLKDIGEYENTLLVFMSDNGANSRDSFRTETNVQYFDANFDNTYDNLGSATSWVAPGPEWAEAITGPFSRYKQYVRQGGLVSPLIISGLGVSRGVEFRDSYLTVMDLAPTFIELASASYPSDGSVSPMRGESMVELLQGKTEEVHGENYSTVMYHHGRAFVRQGDWKLVTLEGPFDEARFQLFDLSADPGESIDLRHEEPRKFEEMLELWRRERRAVGIALPEER